MAPKGSHIPLLLLTAVLGRSPLCCLGTAGYGPHAAVEAPGPVVWCSQPHMSQTTDSKPSFREITRNDSKNHLQEKKFKSSFILLSQEKRGKSLTVK